MASASWLTNLDEDWVSEGGSSPSSPASAVSPQPSKLRVVPNPSNLQNCPPRSRIPRPKGVKEDSGFQAGQRGVLLPSDVHCDQSAAHSRTSTISTQNSVTTQICYQSTFLDGNTLKRFSGDISRSDENIPHAFMPPASSYPDSNLKRKIADLITNGGHLQDLFSPIHLERIFKPLNDAKHAPNTFPKPSSPGLLLPRHLPNALAYTPLRPDSLSTGFVDSSPATATEASAMLTEKPAYKANETLPLATSTVRRVPPPRRSMSNSDPTSVYNRSCSITRENANETFSPINLGSEKMSLGSRKPLEALCDGEESAELSTPHTPSTMQDSSSPDGTCNAGVLDDRLSQLESAAPKPRPPAHQEALTPVRRSAKRTSMGNAKALSPGLAQSAKATGIDAPSSPLLERTPKRVRLSNISDCADASIEREMEVLGVQCGEKDVQHPLERSDMPAGSLSSSPSLADEEAAHSDVPPCNRGGDIAAARGHHQPAQDERDWCTSVTQGIQFHITGLTSIKTIPPSSVSNIIPKRIGQMTFDEKQLRWIRLNRSLENAVVEGEGQPGSHLKEDAFSDEDPLKDISDLSTEDSVAHHVSFNPEKKNSEDFDLQRPGQRRPHHENDDPEEKADQNPSSDHSFTGSRGQTTLRVRASDETVDLEPSIAEGNLSEGPSNTSDFAESNSYENLAQEQGETSAYDYSSALALEHDFTREATEFFEHADSSMPSSRTDSSVSRQAIGRYMLLKPNRLTAHDVPETPIHNITTPSMRMHSRGNYDRQNKGSRPLVSGMPRAENSGSRSAELLRHLDIQSGSAATSRQLFLSPFRPEKLKGIRSEVPPPSTTNNKEVSFFNTPLPELSYHYLDAESAMQLEISYVAKFRGDTTRQRAITSFSAATNNLVKHLTDIEPYEPYWEYTKQLRLIDKDLVTLHTLNEFCPRIEDLDVHSNKLGQVTGVPHTVRDLNVSQNRLSSLTTWGHLVNLQYLDVSGNDLDSLSGLKHLVHLRELNADCNYLTELSDIFHLDGLLSFSARRNAIKVLDFNGSNLKRLGTLDLKDNEIESIANIHRLSSLSSLNLDNNKLRNLGLSKGQTIENLRTLKANKNILESLDITSIPNIRVLYLDDNRIKRLDNLNLAKHLDSFSVRQQHLESSESPKCDIPFDELQEVRKLYISGNQLSDFSTRQDFPNLQYLEIACAQLTSLPKEFGMMMSNVRVLNLNCNAIADLKPLYGIMRLKKLELAGNRLSSLKKVSGMLKHFPTLRELDLRFNPLTVGFYSHLPDTEIAGRTTPNESGVKDLGTLDDAFKQKMDTRTAIQRRCYEIVIGEHCPKLKKLDELKFSTAKTLQKDSVWEQMKALGIVSNGGIEKAAE